ncbi:uncharacterized protein LOC128642373 [Bombina bombina]|uniref:uncharacterized protein LOC128642373 n=1 Tax=Bombina bombina TaxID=8345 RepID=UPI00235A90DC|nr:uncharacterized protein LOC128642373 [Bombina bombina]
MDITKMNEFIINFNLNDCKPHGNQGYNRVLLQLFGYLGHGKSSFINTCKYVLGCKDEWHADVARSDGGKTTQRKAYPLTRNITLVDNRGCAKMSDQETGEIYAQLGNLLPLYTEVQWQNGYRGIMNRIVETDMNANYSDFVVPVFIYSVKKGISTEEMPNIKTLLDNDKKLTGVAPIVVLTFKTQGNLMDVETKFKNIGTDHIFKLENYTWPDGIQQNYARQNEVLTFLCEALKNVQYHMRDWRNPDDEREQRKLFLLEFTHETEKKVERLRKERELALEREQVWQIQREMEKIAMERRRQERLADILRAANIWEVEEEKICTIL